MDICRDLAHPHVLPTLLKEAAIDDHLAELLKSALTDIDVRKRAETQNARR
jgi:hypothetical protein